MVVRQSDFNALIDALSDHASSSVVKSVATDIRARRLGLDEGASYEEVQAAAAEAGIKLAEEAPSDS